MEESRWKSRGFVIYLKYVKGKVFKQEIPEWQIKGKISCNQI